MGIIIGSAVAALLVAGVLGVALAVAFDGNDNGDEPSFAPPTPSAVSSETPSPTPAAGTETPSPTPGPVDSLTPTPTPTPSAGGGEGGATQLIEVENIAQEVPTDWAVLKQEADSIIVREPTTNGLLVLSSATLNSDITARDLQNHYTEWAEDNYPDAKACGETRESAVPGGPEAGLLFGLCYTVTPQGGEAYRAVDLYFVGAQGRSYFSYNLYAPADRWEAFVERWKTLRVPVWKLFSR